MKFGLVALFVSALTAHAASAAEPIQLVSSYSVSPDGATIVFAWADDIWTASTSGGDARRLTTHSASDSQPRFSPDGREIAFISSRDGGRHIYTMPLTGGPPHRHTTHSEGYRLVEYSPKGDAFLVQAQRDHFWRDGSRFFRVERDAKTAEQLVVDAAGTDARLSPDGKKLLISREGTSGFRKGYEGSQASQIWLFDLESREFTELLRDEVGFRYPRWMPDGSGLYYCGQQSGSYNLWQCKIDGTERRQLTFFDDDTVFAPAVSKDGSTIVFAHLFDLYRFSPGSGKPPERIELANSGEPVRRDIARRTLTSATDAVFSDDGLEVAFVAGGDLWVMDTELREPKRVTRTPEEESSPEFTKDGNRIFFISDRGGQTDIYSVERGDTDRYWWQNDDFDVQRITQDPAIERYLDLASTGEFLAFVRGRGDLCLMDTDGKNVRTLFESWNAPDFEFSPDGKWVAYAIDDNDFNRDIWLAPLDGSREPFNVSVHPDNDRGPSWSPDGRVLAWTARRSSEETDIHYAYLRLEDAQEDSRDRRVEKAIETMKKKRKEPKPAKKDDASDKVADAKPDAKDGAKKDDPKKTDEAEDDKAIVIDFDGLRDRIRTISNPDSRESTLRWLSDTKLAFNATVNGASGSYFVEFPSATNSLKKFGSSIRGSKYVRGAKSLSMVTGGQPALISSTGTTKRFPFTAYQEIRNSQRYQAGFDLAWRAMRDGFYDPNLGNRNWDAVRRKYIDAATNAVDSAAFTRVVQLMLGELNGSHLGFSSRGARRGASSDFQWNEITGHLGLRFESDHLGPGWKVRDVVRGGPTWEKETRVDPGEVILSIDGVPIDPSMPVEKVLTGAHQRDIGLRVKSVSGEERDITVRPTTYAGVRRRLYDHWLEDNRARVDEWSKGSLGYLHVRGMNWSSFLKFETELFKVGHGKDGLIIDVRANGGGSTADHLLTVLTQPRHAITRPRGGGEGYPQDRRVYATWDKPIIVLCDQDSFSNAEIFAHAIKTLNRGQVVGMTTAGGVISTGGRGIMDLGFLRMPFRGWYLLDGEDMELNGAVPHHIVQLMPGDWPAGRDPQLAKGVEVLLEDVADWKARPRPTLRKSSERRAIPTGQGRTARF